jgi:hypothetical protein
MLSKFVNGRGPSKFEREEKRERERKREKERERKKEKERERERERERECNYAWPQQKLGVHELSSLIC